MAKKPKKNIVFDPRTGTYTDKAVQGGKPVDLNTLTQQEGHGGGFALPGGVEFTGTPHKPSDAFGLGVGSSKQAAGSGSSPKAGAGISYDPDNMIRSYLPGLTPQQSGFIRQQLSGAEKGSGADYHKALDALVAGHPELGQYSPWSKLFPQQQQGQLSPETMGRLLELTSQYQKPYLDQLKNISSGVSSSLQKLLPNLPSSYKGLIQSEIPVYAHLGEQLGAALSAANPGTIANAYAQAYAPQSQAASASNNLFSNLLGQIPQK